MTQKQITRAIAKQFFLSQSESKKILKFILDEIAKELKEKNRIYLRDLGVFTKQKRAPQKVRHPKTGKIITKPARITVEFKPSKKLLKKILS